MMKDVRNITDVCVPFGRESSSGARSQAAFFSGASGLWCGSDTVAGCRTSWKIVPFLFAAYSVHYQLNRCFLQSLKGRSFSCLGQIAHKLHLPQAETHPVLSYLASYSTLFDIRQMGE